MLATKSRNKPVSLIILIAAQVFCAAFFVWDVFADYRESGIGIDSNFHLLGEMLAVLGLCAAIIFEFQYLRQLLLREANLRANLSLAATAMHDIVTELFEQWRLTASEKDVAMLMVKGFSIAEIANIRGSAEGTVKAHLNAIYRKSGTSNRGDLLSLLIDPLMGKPLLEEPSEKAR